VATIGALAHPPRPHRPPAGPWGGPRLVAGVQRERTAQRDRHLVAAAADRHRARRHMVQARVAPHRRAALVPAAPPDARPRGTASTSTLAEAARAPLARQRQEGHRAADRLTDEQTRHKSEPAAAAPWRGAHPRDLPKKNAISGCRRCTQVPCNASLLPSRQRLRKKRAASGAASSNTSTSSLPARWRAPLWTRAPRSRAGGALGGRPRGRAPSVSGPWRRSKKTCCRLRSRSGRLGSASVLGPRARSGCRPVRWNTCAARRGAALRLSWRARRAGACGFSAYLQKTRLHVSPPLLAGRKVLWPAAHADGIPAKARHRRGLSLRTPCLPLQRPSVAACVRYLSSKETLERDSLMQRESPSVLARRPRCLLHGEAIFLCKHAKLHMLLRI